MTGRERAVVDVGVWLEASDRAALFALATALVERMPTVVPVKRTRTKS